MRTVPLSRRILLVTLAGGLVVAFVAFLLSVPVVRDVAHDQDRAQLVRSIETFSGSTILIG